MFLSKLEVFYFIKITTIFFKGKDKTFLSNSLNLCALSTSCIPIRIISYCRIPFTRHYFLEQKTLTISPDIIPPHTPIQDAFRKKNYRKKKAARNEPPQIQKNVFYFARRLQNAENANAIIPKNAAISAGSGIVYIMLPGPPASPTMENSPPSAFPLIS